MRPLVWSSVIIIIGVFASGVSLAQDSVDSETGRLTVVPEVVQPGCDAIKNAEDKIACIVKGNIDGGGRRPPAAAVPRDNF